MKQKFDLLDTESGYVLSIEGQTEVLTKDITIVLPDTDNAVLATTKEIEDLRSYIFLKINTNWTKNFTNKFAENYA